MFKIVEYALRSDGMTVITNYDIHDESPEYTGKLDSQCYFCQIGWKHSKWAHIHRLEESLKYLKGRLKGNL